jgi:hypothetical protein
MHVKRKDWIKNNNSSPLSLALSNEDPESTLIHLLVLIGLPTNSYFLAPWQEEIIEDAIILPIKSVVCNKKNSNPTL